MPAPLDAFDRAFRELLEAPDAEIDELAARDPLSGIVPEVARIKVARAIQQHRSWLDRMRAEKRLEPSG
jgi:hypothetical protein